MRWRPVARPSAVCFLGLRYCASEMCKQNGASALSRPVVQEAAELWRRAVASCPVENDLAAAFEAQALLMRPTAPAMAAQPAPTPALPPEAAALPKVHIKCSFQVLREFPYPHSRPLRSSPCSYSVFPDPCSPQPQAKHHRRLFSQGAVPTAACRRPWRLQPTARPASRGPSPRRGSPRQRWRVPQKRRRGAP